MVCPKEYVTLIPFEQASCKLSYYYVETVQLPFLPMSLNHFQIHTLVLGIFASFISPFGGLFASGFKRALKIKDFADIIPGHGGITDRMDCQILMVSIYFILGNVHLCLLASSGNWRFNCKKVANELHIYIIKQ